MNRIRADEVVPGMVLAAPQGKSERVTDVKILSRRVEITTATPPPRDFRIYEFKPHQGVWVNPPAEPEGLRIYAVELEVGDIIIAAWNTSVRLRVLSTIARGAPRSKTLRVAVEAVSRQAQRSEITSLDFELDQTVTIEPRLDFMGMLEDANKSDSSD